MSPSSLSNISSSDSIRYVCLSSRYPARRPSRSSPDASPWEKGGSVQASTTHSQWPIFFFPVTLAPQQCAVCLNTQGCPIAPLAKVARDPEQRQTQSRSAATKEDSVRIASRGRYGSTVGARREEEFEDRIGARTRTSGAEGRR
jgi:hypothetical protein